MMPAAKQLDPVLGVDIHIIQPPGPVPPVPIPHPFIGMVFDPMEFAPILGATVIVNGLPAAIAGTEVKCLPPHIPIGGVFVPPPPGNEGEIFMGSMTVAFDGDAASHLLHPVLTCQSIGLPAIPRLKKKAKKATLMLPTSMVLAVPAGAPVLIGGPPTISLMAMGMKVAMAGLGKLFKKLKATKLGQKLAKKASDAADAASDAFKKVRQKVFKKLPPGKLKCDILKAEPVNSVTGEVVVEQQDFTIPGRIPFEWNRTWTSQETYEGLLGKGWQTPADARLEIDRDGDVLFYDGGPGATVFPGVLLSDDEPVYELMDGAKLYRENGAFHVKRKTGEIFEFEPIDTAHHHGLKGPKTLRIVRVKDAFNNYLEYQRDPHGRLVRIQESAGRFIEVTSTKEGRIEKMMFAHPDSKERKPLVAFGYKNDNLVTVWDALNQPYRFVYEDDMLVRHTDRNGLSFYYEYDQKNKVGKCIHAWGDGGLYDYTFEFLSRETRFTNSLGHKRRLTFDENFLPTGEFDDEGPIEEYEYDVIGRTTAVIDGGGNRTEYEYDRFGNVTKLTRADGSTVVSEYDENQNLVKVVDPNGNEWRQEWDARGSLNKQITPLGNETRYGYSLHGELVSVVEPGEVVSRLETDRFGNAAKFIDAHQNESIFRCDFTGNLLEQISPTGMCSQYHYDRKDRIVAIVNPSGSNIACVYDGEDNLTRYRDENGAVTTLEYAGLGEIRRRIQADGTVVEYEYDTEERLIGVINERKQKYTLNRNRRGYVIEEIDYWGGTRKYKYDAAQNLIEAVNPLGRISRFTCDALGRLTEKTLFDGKTESYQYDSNGNLIVHKNDIIECRRIFDAEGRMLREEQGNAWVESSYDGRGNRVERRTNYGNKVEYSYNTLDDLESIAINDSPAITVQSDKEGRPVKEVLGGVVERDYEYNADGLLTRQHVYTSAFELAKRKYAYDPVGNLVSRTDSKKGTIYFSYDPLGRLKQSINPKGQIEKFLHDPAGDLLQSTHQFDEDKGRRKSSYNGADYYFDVAGNLVERHTDKGTATFEWDGNDRLWQSENERGQKVEMVYDAQGRRMAKKVNGAAVQFTWDRNQLLADNKECNNSREFIYYPGTFEPLAHIDAEGDIFYYQNDNVGLPHEICSGSGHVVWSATYTPHGAVNEQYESQLDNPLRFQGQYHDEEIGLNYNLFRFYDPHTGAFVSQDPLGLAAGNSVYRYAPNCWGWVDPLGLKCSKTDDELLADAKAIHNTIPKGRAFNGITVAVGEINGKLVYTVNQNKTSKAMRDKAEELGYERVFGKQFKGDNQTDAEQIMLNWAEENNHIGSGKTSRIAPSRPACGPKRQDCAGRIERTEGVKLIGPKKET